MLRNVLTFLFLFVAFAAMFVYHHKKIKTLVLHTT